MALPPVAPMALPPVRTQKVGARCARYGCVLAHQKHRHQAQAQITVPSIINSRAKSSQARVTCIEVLVEGLSLTPTITTYPRTQAQPALTTPGSRPSNEPRRQKDSTATPLRPEPRHPQTAHVD